MMNAVKSRSSIL